jgi:hypothetical protein
VSEWTSGYVADIDYTYGYYQELNPLRAQIALLHAGIRYPSFENACELGFGQGLSTNFHAASTNTNWWGTDFNPAQAGFARDMATAAESNAQLFDEDFTTFCSRKDLPEFDFIGLHGIWSWISDENRRVIVDFVRRKLRVGGVLYVSYNTLPGWASFAPIRQLMTQHADVIGSEGRGIVSKIDGAVEFAKSLLDTNPLYKRANPNVEDRLKKIESMSRHYLAHEYFNKDWHPMHFATVTNWLNPAKVDFACSAHLLDHFDNVNLQSEQREFVKNIPDRMLRESVRDFMVNQQFRRDFWVKGLRRIPQLERMESLASLEILLITDPSDVSLTVNSGQGEANMSEKVYLPVLDAMSNQDIVTIGSLQSSLKKQNSIFSLATVVEAVMVLISIGHVVPIQDNRITNTVKTKAKKINSHILKKTRSSAEIGYMLSPVTGGGISVERFQQLFISAIESGAKDASAIAQAAWYTLSLSGQKLIKDGSPLETEQENLTELETKATEFLEKRLPLLRTLKITK